MRYTKKTLAQCFSISVVWIISKLNWKFVEENYTIYLQFFNETSYYTIKNSTGHLLLSQVLQLLYTEISNLVNISSKTETEKVVLHKLGEQIKISYFMTFCSGETFTRFSTIIFYLIILFTFFLLILYSLRVTTSPCYSSVRDNCKYVGKPPRILFQSAVLLNSDSILVAFLAFLSQFSESNSVKNLNP